MKRILIIAALVLATTPTMAEDVQFQTPSGNIGCEYQPAIGDRLYCVRLKPAMRYIEFGTNGAQTGGYEGDSWFPAGAPVLAYGESRFFGPYQCTSERSGLTCERGGHGFTASRKGIVTH